MEPKELIYNVYKDITSIKTKFDDENLWCNPYKTIQGLTPMTPGLCYLNGICSSH